jgi:hypothetical protein
VSLTMWGAQQLRDATDQYALDSEHQTDLLKNRLDAIEFTEAQNLTYQDCGCFRSMSTVSLSTDPDALVILLVIQYTLCNSTG